MAKTVTYTCSCGRENEVIVEPGVESIINTCKVCGVKIKLNIIRKAPSQTSNKAPVKPSSKGVKKGEETKKKKVEEKNTGVKKTKEPEESFSGGDRNEIRIKLFKNEKMDIKLKRIITKLKESYPKLFLGNMTFDSFIQQVFPAKILQDCIITNQSFDNGNGKIRRRASIRNLSSSYLNRNLPENVCLIFYGRLVDGEFLIEELKEVENPKESIDDIKKQCVFLYDGPKNSNCLYDITEEIAKGPEVIGGKLALWNEYLDWKRQLAELKIKGIKYVSVASDFDNKQMTFLCVAPSKEVFEDFKSVLHKNEMSAVGNSYSINRWEFEFNREIKDAKNNNSDNEVHLHFIEISNQYFLENGIDFDVWNEQREYCNKYKEGELAEEGNLDFILKSFLNKFPEAYVAELVFEMSSEATAHIENTLKYHGMITNQLVQDVLGEYYAEGFIAVSQVGDFALISRFKWAIKELQSGRSANQGLKDWLFDIKEARKPEKIEKIHRWQNKSMNHEQKRAVEKMISATDVCLIQGPPGTGKTTVIAEAIYQFVIRNKRVLITSQANLAVDNALERLISNPNVRAIRLGNRRKIDSSVENIMEKNVLETFYGSIVKLIDSEYIEGWVKTDEKLKRINEKLEKIKFYNEKYDEQAKLINIEKGKAYRIVKTIEEETKKVNYQYEKVNNHRAERVNINAVLSLCKGDFQNIDFSLFKDTLVNIFSRVNEELKVLENHGIFLSRISVDVDKLVSPLKQKSANDILYKIIESAYIFKKLIDKINGDNEGLESNEYIEELKLRREILLKRLEKGEISVYDKWREVSSKILELEAAVKSGALSEEEKQLFSEEIIEVWGNSQDRNSFISSILEDNIELVDSIILQIESTCTKLIEKYNLEEAGLSNRIDDLDKELQLHLNKLEELENNNKELKEMLSEVCAPYERPDKALKEYNKKITELTEEENKKLNRKKWEPIFTELKSWVENIPDYTQENEMYLNSYINGCNVVGVSCTERSKTLTDKGFDDFDVVIIDEVSKATPPEILISLIKGKKAILVGDHRQLPPLFNEHEKSYLEMIEEQENMEDPGEVLLTRDDFEKYKNMVTASLFEDYFENASDVMKQSLLSQYRMHSDIMELVNKFYDGKLKQGCKDIDDSYKAHNLSIYSSYGAPLIEPRNHAYWFDSSNLKEKRIFEQRRDGSTSAENILEAHIIIELLKKVEEQYSNSNRTFPVSVGVISFYFDQVKQIKNMVKNISFHYIDVEVNTVDRFQGKEKEIIFVSLVRNVRSERRNIDSHIAAFQRINVAFSRAQNLLVIVGACDMYANQPVVLTDMDDGEEKTTYVYREIIEILDRKGCRFTADEIISDNLAYDIHRKLIMKGSVGE